MAADAEHAHAERGAEPADIPADAARADHAGGLAVDQQRAVAVAVELARMTVRLSVMKILREMQDPRDRIFGDRQRLNLGRRP